MSKVKWGKAEILGDKDWKREWAYHGVGATEDTAFMSYFPQIRLHLWICFVITLFLKQMTTEQTFWLGFLYLKSSPTLQSLHTQQSGKSSKLNLFSALRHFKS